MAKKRLKIYLNDSVVQEFNTHTDLSRNPFSWLPGWVYSLLVPVLWVLERLGSALFYLCYVTGLSLIYLVQKPYYAIQKYVLSPQSPRDSSGEVQNKWERYLVLLHAKLRRLLDPQVRIGLTLFLGMIGVSFLFFRSAQIVNTAWEVRDRIVGTAGNGFDQITKAQQSLQGQETNLAETHFSQAIASFQSARTELNSTGGILNGLLDIFPQKRGADDLLEAVGLVGRAGLSLTKFYELSRELHFSGQGLTGKNSVAATIGHMQTEVHASLQSISQAQTLMKEINPSILPNDKRLTFVEARGKISVMNTGLETFSQLFDALALLTKGDKRILLLSENNNELRPGGGFIGTFGDIRLRQGTISSIHVSSIYDLDGQLKAAIAPPQPMWIINDRWYMRDSNWFFDFPTTSKKVAGFYEKEGGETPDVVIMMTPSLITGLLTVTGPIAMPQYGTTLSADNFVEQTQFETSVDYDKSLNRPKQFLADFVPALLQRLSELPQNELGAAIESIQKSLTAKQLLIYARDPEIQSKLDAFNWTGRVKPADRDYLAVVTANLSGTKTDLGIDQDISLDSSVEESGSIINTLRITRINTLPSLPGMENRSFVRIFVPQGAKLISAEGFSTVELPNSLGENSEADPDVYEWEKHTVRDVTTQTLIGEESGKSFFGNWMTVEGQKRITATVTYRLPISLKELDHYSLLLQKQPGSVRQHFTYSLHFDGYAIPWKNFDGDVSSHTVTLPVTEVDRDLFYGLVLNKASGI